MVKCKREGGGGDKKGEQITERKRRERLKMKERWGVGWCTVFLLVSSARLVMVEWVWGPVTRRSKTL